MPETTPGPISIYERFPVLRDIEAEGKMPGHVAIIMDGNRTWARKTLGETAKPVQGHRAGMERIIGVLRDLREIERIKFVTLWAFSPENWKRDPEEVANLMGLFTNGIPAMVPEIQANNGRFVHLGRKEKLPREVLEAIENAEVNTAMNTGQTVCLGIDYGAENQRVRVAQQLVDFQLPAGTIVTADMLKDLEDTHLSDGTLVPPIDLVFRTSGQLRLSGLPNADYAEFFPIEACLPDTTTGDFIDGLLAFSGRERRFGADCSTK